MSSPPYMPLWVADYVGDTMHLTTLEHGAYLLLIMTYWQRGGPLPAANDRLANVARLSNERWESVRQTLAEFFEEVDGHWVHPRIEAELNRVKERSAKASASGKASGERRRSVRPTNVQRSLNERSTDVERTPNYPSSDPNIELVTPLPPSPQAKGQQGLKNGLKGGRGSEVREQTLKRAEQLGLPVDEIVAEARAGNPDNLDAYVQAICRRRLKTLLPNAGDEFLRQAFSRESDAYQKLLGLLSMVP